jgi:hypothetical protein
MEQNYKQDPLEEYFRRTLDDYEAMPSDDLWERVEADLPPPAAPVQPWWMPYRFLLALTAVIALGVLALLVPDSSLRRPQPSAAPTHGRNLKPDTSHFSTKKPAYPQQTFTHRSTVRTQNPSTLPHSAPVPANAAPSGAPSSASPSARSLPAFTRAAASRGLSPSSPAAVAPPQVLALPEAAATAEEGGSEATRPTSPVWPRQAPENAASPRPPSAMAASASEEVLPLAALPARMPAAAASTHRPLGLPPAAPLIRPARLLSGWSAGLYAGCTYTPAAPTPPIPGGKPPHMMFVHQPQAMRPVWEGGLRLRKRISAHWGIEMGAVYSEQTRTSAYLSRFHFGDGRPLSGGGHPPSRREFSHHLNTPNGSAAVDLRMEPTNASDPIPPGEIIRVRAETTEQSSWLKVPVLASFSAGSGRILGIARAGLMAEILLKSDLRLTSFTSENHRLRLAPDTKPILRWTPTRTLSVGYWVSAGAAFRWSRHITLTAEPTLTGRFSNRDAKGQQLPNPASWGGQVGLWYAW